MNNYFSSWKRYNFFTTYEVYTVDMLQLLSNEPRRKFGTYILLTIFTWSNFRSNIIGTTQMSMKNCDGNVGWRKKHEQDSPLTYVYFDNESKSMFSGGCIFFILNRKLCIFVLEQKQWQPVPRIVIERFFFVLRDSINCRNFCCSSTIDRETWNENANKMI